VNLFVPQPSGFFDLARQRLTFRVPPSLTDPSLPPERGDHDIDNESRRLLAEGRGRPAAVLIPVIDRDEPSVLLTVRSATLPDHAGQVAFPGGKIDGGDHTPAAAALREAQEEIGLGPDHIDPLGYLDIYQTTTGYRILPVVARVQPGFILSLNRGEVDEVFEVPLAFLIDPANHQRHQREWKGMVRHYYAMPYQGRYIWGVTAGILKNMHDRLFGV
jgi:8-oxo-dGTP pyrophosphatase MutT (NUDIX family)